MMNGELHVGARLFVGNNDMASGGERESKCSSERKCAISALS